MTNIRYFLFFAQYCSLQTNIEAVDRHFADIYQNMEVRRRHCQPVLSFQLFYREPMFYIAVNDCPVAEFQDMLQAIWQLDYIIVKWSIQSCSNMIVLHAGWVVKDNNLVILIGAGNSGKSTLCYLLTTQKWLLGSDEFTAIDTDIGELIPFPRKILLKPDNHLVLQYKIQAESSNMLHLFDRRYYVQCHAAAKSNLSSYNTVRMVLLDYQPFSDIVFSPLDTLSALRSVLCSCMNIQNISPDLFKRLVLTMGPGTTSHVTYSSAEKLVKILIEEKLV